MGETNFETLFYHLESRKRSDKRKQESKAKQSKEKEKTIQEIR